MVAVVVSFNGGESTLECIRSISPQVNSVVVVDNGSTSESLDLLWNLHGVEISLILLPSNLGLGTALNLGVKKAMSLGAEWILTLDQDSIPDHNMVTKLMEYAEFNLQIKSLSPNLVSFSGSTAMPKIGQVKYAITSGNLVHRNVFEQAGLYNAGYFIDCIDFDFSLRIRKAGFFIHKVGAAKMIHQVGVNSTLPRALKSFYTQHNPVRRYYMFRNYVLLTKSYAGFDLRFILKLGVLYLFFLGLLVIFEKQRLVNLKYISEGLWDGLIGNSGPYSQ